MKKMIIAIHLLPGLLMGTGCTKKTGGPSPDPAYRPPLATLTVSVTKTDPFTAVFSVTASDADNDPLTYSWDFGEGTKKTGTANETFSYAANKTFTIKVAVSDGKAAPVDLSTSLGTGVTAVNINAGEKFQIIEGFGGFGAKDVYWSNGPFTSPDFVNALINDLGLTILRDNIPTDFEDVNDDNDPATTTLSKFSLNSLDKRLQYLKDMKAAGLKKLVVSIWSAPPWMKTNNRIDNGTTANAAPEYNPVPTSADNQLRADMYEEFAERCVAYARIIKEQTGLDIYAISLQNEPRFSQFYESSVFNGPALGALIKVTGRRFKKEGLAIKIFMPEDVGWFDGINALVQPILQDPDAMEHVSIIATHGYAFDGVTAGSADAQTWKAMYNWGASSGKPLWMTETSGFSNDMNGAIDLGKAMYSALNFGNVSAWLFWTLSTSTLDAYSLMSSSGAKSKRYFASKNFYRFILPGARRIGATTPEKSSVYALAFEHPLENDHTIVLINDDNFSRTISLTGTGLQPGYSRYVTDAAQDCKEQQTIISAEPVLLPARSVVTLYSKN